MHKYILTKLIHILSKNTVYSERS